MFIERPKSLSAQATTWLDYKQHNTFRFLVGITPTEFISFLCSCYEGRTNDKFIHRDSRFYDLLERDDEVTVHRRLQIQENLLLHFCRLVVPPDAGVQSQITKSEVKKTKEVTNLRIHVKRAINRIKCFKNFKGTIPVTMIPHVDDIISTCAVLCNFKPKFIKTKEKDSQKQLSVTVNQKQNKTKQKQSKKNFSIYFKSIFQIYTP